MANWWRNLFLGGPFSDGRSERFFDRPLGEPLREAGLLYTQSPRPFNLRKSFAPVGYSMAICFIEGLFSVRNPKAIRRFVVAIYIFALYGMLIRAQTHIDKEVLIVHPSFTNFNSASAVVSEVDMVWVRASHLHVPPNHILPRGFTVNIPVGITNFSMRHVSVRLVGSFVRCEPIRAPAAPYFAVLKPVGCNHTHISAIADTLPCDFLPGISCFAFHGELTKAHSDDKVDFFRHVSITCHHDRRFA